MTDTVQKAKEALWDRYRKLNPDIKVDIKGYIDHSEHNLLQPEWMELIIKDYEEGGGKELELKFRAVHSSAALAANHFAHFKHIERLPTLSLLGRNGARDLRFERKLPIFRGGTPPNLDVWIDRSDEVIAIESKLTEYFVEKQAKFSKACDRLAPPDHSEFCWWTVYEQAKEGKAQHLDIAQLIKHYFGLWKCKKKMNPPIKVRNKLLGC
jgi:hypothetical protein